MIVKSVKPQVKLRKLLLELEEKQKILDKSYKLAHIGTWEYDMINDELHWPGM